MLFNTMFVEEKPLYPRLIFQLDFAESRPFTLGQIQVDPCCCDQNWSTMNTYLYSIYRQCAQRRAIKPIKRGRIAFVHDRDDHGTLREIVTNSKEKRAKAWGLSIIILTIDSLNRGR